MDIKQTVETNIPLVTAAAFLSSTIYDYSYLSKLGLNFLDCWNSILLWSPSIVMAGLVMYFINLFFMRIEKGHTARELEEKIAHSKYPKLGRIFNFGYITLIRLLFISSLLVYLLEGEKYSPYHEETFLGTIALFFLWETIYSWLSNYNKFNLYFGSTFKLLIKYIPALSMVFYFYGYWHATAQCRALEYTVDNLTLINGDSYCCVRSIEKGSLVFDKKNKQLSFIPWDKIEKISFTQQINKYKGILNLLTTLTRT